MQQHLRWAFAGRGSVQHLFDDLVLCVSELVSTAIEARASEISLTLDRTPSRIRLAMADHSPAGNTAASRLRRDRNGHRTRIIDAVASDWGVDADADGSQIWVDFALNGTAGSVR